MSNILVIGNGFDLSHGLRTKYSDFIDFLKYVDTFSDKGEISAELREIIKTNGFIRFILNEKEIDKEYWTDLEELLFILTTQIHKLFFEKIDENGGLRDERFGLNELDTKVIDHFGLRDPFLAGFDEKNLSNETFFSRTYGVKWQSIRKYLVKHLEELKIALVIYLRYYLQEVSGVAAFSYKQIRDINPDSIITFNYTKYYDRYSFAPEEIIHVHGNIDDEKIVLGYNDIDERDLDLIVFKKYYQRLRNKLPSIYSSKYLKPSMDNPPNVFIYGLSLDKKDEDLIKHIINSSMRSTIFYSEDIEGDYEQKLINLLSVFGKEEVLRYLSSEKIVFIPIEKEMI